MGCCPTTWPPSVKLHNPGVHRPNTAFHAHWPRNAIAVTHLSTRGGSEYFVLLTTCPPAAVRPATQSSASPPPPTSRSKSIKWLLRPAKRHFHLIARGSRKAARTRTAWPGAHQTALEMKRSTCRGPSSIRLHVSPVATPMSEMVARSSRQPLETGQARPW
ncbi:hypothetical protein D915_010235 [Fasciola hepatica]|uniref:Uncharacterized protein n=1 Tax=Fasciola hepatica TaxID=6192 RepID=A0A4E0RBP8_FASHE|nr:hypothetical protein D915_010235 [Fasciola hepatica]